MQGVRLLAQAGLQTLAQAPAKHAQQRIQALQALPQAHPRRGTGVTVSQGRFTDIAQGLGQRLEPIRYFSFQITSQMIKAAQETLDRLKSVANKEKRDENAELIAGRSHGWDALADLSCSSLPLGKPCLRA